jgi:hypothetical protein
MRTIHEYEDSGEIHRSPKQSDDNQTISEAVISAVAEYAGVTEQSLPPVDQSINPNGLNVLFDSEQKERSLGGCVTFSYYGHTVVVQSTGQILIREN